MKLEIDNEVSDEITRTNLGETLTIFKTPNKYIPFFSMYPKEEKKKVKKMIKSLELVLNWYSVPTTGVYNE